MGTLGDFLKSLDGRTDMLVVVAEVISRSNYSHFQTVHKHVPANAGVENWGLGLGVASYKKKEVSVIEASDV